MRLVLALLALGPLALATTGCRGPSAEAPPPVVAATAEDPVLVLGDVQYLLGEAVAAHSAEARAVAERSWGDAVTRWREVLAPRVRAKDPRKALEIEYALGRLGDALRRSGGHPGNLHKPLDRALRDLEPVLATTTAPADPAEASP